MAPIYVTGSKDTQTKASAGKESASVGPYPVDSTTRAMSVDSRTPSLLVSALSGAHHIGIPTSTAGLFLGRRPHKQLCVQHPKPILFMHGKYGIKNLARGIAVLHWHHLHLSMTMTSTHYVCSHA